MAKKKRAYNLALFASLLTFTLSGCDTQQATNANVTTTQDIDLTGVEFSDVSVSYDGYPHSIYATNVPSDVSVTYENNGAVNVGTYKIIAKFSKRTSGTASNVKYRDKIQIATLSILTAATDISDSLKAKLDKLTMQDLAATYDGSTYAATLDDPSLVPAGFIAVYSNNTHTAAGEYAVTCNIINQETMVVYKTLHCKMVISKAEIDISAVAFEDQTYPLDGSVHLLEATNLPDKVSVRYEVIENSNKDNQELDANAVLAVGYKKVRAVFSVNASSSMDRNNYTIVNLAKADKTDNKMIATITVMPAGSVAYTIKYRVHHSSMKVNANNESYYEKDPATGEDITNYYELDGITGQPAIYSSSTLNAVYGSYITPSNLISRAGYSFKIVDEEYADILDSKNGYLIPDGSTGGTIVVDYVPNVYTVNFSVNNGTLPSRTYTVEESSTLINPILSDGYRFIGWYTDSSYTNPITTLKGLTGNRTIYARVIKDEQIGTFSIRDTFVTYEEDDSGNPVGKNIDASGSVPSDVKIKYEYYEIDSNGNQTLINGIDENMRPSAVGKYSVKVKFFTIKTDPETGDEVVTTEERYSPIIAYLIIQPKTTNTSDSTFANTSFEYTGDVTTGNYPKLVNYPSNIKEDTPTYEYYDSNFKKLNAAPVDPGTYYSYASYTLKDGTTDGQKKTFKATFTITKKEYKVEFTNVINTIFPDITYVLNGSNVEVTRGDGVSYTKTLTWFRTTAGYDTFKLELLLKDGDGNIVGNYNSELCKTLLESISETEKVYLVPTIKDEVIDGVSKVVFHFNRVKYTYEYETEADGTTYKKNPDGSYIVKRYVKNTLSTDDYAPLVVNYASNQIDFNATGQIESTVYFTFYNESDAKLYTLPANSYSTLSVYTKGKNTVKFVAPNGDLIYNTSVNTGMPVVVPNIPVDYLPETNYEATWISNSPYSTLDYIVGDTVFTLNNKVAKKFKVTFEIDSSCKGTITKIDNQIFTVDTSTKFADLDVANLVSYGYEFDKFYLIDSNGVRTNVSLSQTFADASKLVNSLNDECQDYTVYVTTRARTTTGIFDANGGILTTGTNFVQTFGQRYNFPEVNPTLNGATFLGWSLNGVMVSSNSVYEQYTTQTLRFYAEYSKPTNYVTFLPENGDKYTTYTVDVGDTIPVLSTPVKYGYSFVGWYTTNGVKLTEGSTFKGGSSLVYLAKYEALPITIRFNDKAFGEETSVIATGNSYYLGSIPTPLDENGNRVSAPTVSGCTFLGWSFDGSTIIDDNTVIETFTQRVIDGVSVCYANVYPVYQNNNYKITYVYNVENVLDTASSVVYKEVINLATPATRIGYYFAGWYTTSTYDEGTNFQDILNNPTSSDIDVNCYPYERNVTLYAKWVRKTYKVTFKYIPDNAHPEVYNTVSGISITYGQVLSTELGTWLTDEQIYTSVGLNLSKAVVPIFTFGNGTVVTEGEAFLYDPLNCESDYDLSTKEYDINNPDNNTCIVSLSSSTNNYFTISYIADSDGLPTIQTVFGNADFTLQNNPTREGKRWVAYYYLYQDGAVTKKYYLTSDGTIDGTPLTKWNLSDESAKNGVEDYVLYSEFKPLRYRLIFRTNDQKSILGYYTAGDGKQYDKYVETEYGSLYNISSNELSTDFKSYINEELKKTGYKFDYWRDNYGRIITTNTVLTLPRATDIDSSFVYDADGNIDYANSELSAGIYLYAQVLPLSYTITYLPDNNSNPYVINVKYNETYSKMGNPVKDGFRFVGWKYYYADKFSVDAYNNGTLPSDAELPYNSMDELSFNQTSDIVACAQYAGDEYEVTYKYNILDLSDITTSGSTSTPKVSQTSVMVPVVYKDSFNIDALDVVNAKSNTSTSAITGMMEQYLSFYEFVGWQDEQTLVIYQPGAVMKEYLKSANSSFVALYKAKEFTFSFTYTETEKTLPSSSVSTHTVTKVVTREKISFGDSISTPSDPLPSDSTFHSDGKTWIGTTANTISLEGTFDFSFDQLVYFFYNDFDKLLDTVTAGTLQYDYTFTLFETDNVGYYQIILNNSDQYTIYGNTNYNVYGEKVTGIERGDKIKLPNINKTISLGEQFVDKDALGAINNTQIINYLNGAYSYKINGQTYLPFLRTVYVINGEYFLDGEYSPIGITGASRTEPTTLYAFTTYVAGHISSDSYSELYSFSLNDENGDPLCATSTNEVGPIVDSDNTLDSLNQIAFTGFANKEYTSLSAYAGVGSTRNVLIPYFYYDGIKIRKVTTIANDMSGNGAFKNSTYATSYYIPNTVSYIVSGSFENAFSGSEDSRVVYLDSSSYFDSLVLVEDKTLTQSGKLMTISSLGANNIFNFTYTGVDASATFTTHPFFAGRTFADISRVEAVNIYTVVQYINSFNNSAEYTDSEKGPQGKQGQTFYYSTTYIRKIPMYFMKVNDALTEAYSKNYNNTIMGFSQTVDPDTASGQVLLQSYPNKNTCYPYYVFLGSPIDFAKTYSTKTEIDNLKITADADLPKTINEYKYANKPYYVIDKFYLTLPYTADGIANNTKDYVGVKSLSDLRTIYMSTASEICAQLYSGTTEGENYFTSSGDISDCYSNTDFVTCYASFTEDSKQNANIDYFYNGDDEGNGLTGAEYFIKLLTTKEDDDYDTYELGQQLRANYAKKCYAYTYDSSGNIARGAKLSRIIAVKNYKLKCAEYFYLGTYEQFLETGEENVSKYKGKMMTFLKSTDETLSDDDPLAVINEDSELERVYIGTSSEWLNSNTIDSIGAAITNKYTLKCMTSPNNYLLTDFYFGTVEQYLTEEGHDRNEMTVAQCLRTTDVSDLQNIRSSQYIYFGESTRGATTNIQYKKMDNWYFNDDGEITKVNDDFNFLNDLIKEDGAYIIYQTKPGDGHTLVDCNIYYTKDVETFVNTQNYSAFKDKRIICLRRDYDVEKDIDGVSDRTTTDTYKDFELLYVGLKPSNISSVLNSDYMKQIGLTDKKYFAFYLAEKQSSAYAYLCTETGDWSSTRVTEFSSDKFYLDYFFNCITDGATTREKTIVYYSNYLFYNENTKTVLLNYLMYSDEVQKALTNRLIKTLYNYDVTNLTTDNNCNMLQFVNTYLGTATDVENNLIADKTTFDSQMKEETDSLFFVKSNLYDMDSNILNDDMELAYWKNGKTEINDSGLNMKDALVNSVTKNENSAYHTFILKKRLITIFAHDDKSSATDIDATNLSEKEYDHFYYYLYSLKDGTTESSDGANDSIIYKTIESEGTTNYIYRNKFIYCEGVSSSITQVADLEATGTFANDFIYTYVGSSTETVMSELMAERTNTFIFKANYPYAVYSYDSTTTTTKTEIQPDYSKPVYDYTKPVSDPVYEYEDDGVTIKTDADGNKIIKKDDDGNDMYELRKDEDGNQVYEQKKDEDGNLVYETHEVEVIDKTITNNVFRIAFTGDHYNLEQNNSSTLTSAQRKEAIEYKGESDLSLVSATSDTNSYANIVYTCLFTFPGSTYTIGTKYYLKDIATATSISFVKYVRNEETQNIYNRFIFFSWTDENAVKETDAYNIILKTKNYAEASSDFFILRGNNSKKYGCMVQGGGLVLDDRYETGSLLADREDAAAADIGLPYYFGSITSATNDYGSTTFDNDTLSKLYEGYEILMLGDSISEDFTVTGYTRNRNNRLVYLGSIDEFIQSGKEDYDANNGLCRYHYLDTAVDTVSATALPNSNFSRTALIRKDGTVAISSSMPWRRYDSSFYYIDSEAKEVRTMTLLNADNYKDGASNFIIKASSSQSTVDNNILRLYRHAIDTNLANMLPYMQGSANRTYTSITPMITFVFSDGTADNNYNKQGSSYTNNLWIGSENNIVQTLDSSGNTSLATGFSDILKDNSDEQYKLLESERPTDSHYNDAYYYMKKDEEAVFLFYNKMSLDIAGTYTSDRCLGYYIHTTVSEQEVVSERWTDYYRTNIAEEVENEDGTTTIEVDWENNDDLTSEEYKPDESVCPTVYESSTLVDSTAPVTGTDYSISGLKMSRINAMLSLDPGNDNIDTYGDSYYNSSVLNQDNQHVVIDYMPIVAFDIRIKETINYYNRYYSNPFVAGSTTTLTYEKGKYSDTVDEKELDSTLEENYVQLGSMVLRPLANTATSQIDTTSSDHIAVLQSMNQMIRGVFGIYDSFMYKDLSTHSSKTTNYVWYWLKSASASVSPSGYTLKRAEVWKTIYENYKMNNDLATEYATYYSITSAFSNLQTSITNNTTLSSLHSKYRVFACKSIFDYLLRYANEATDADSKKKVQDTFTRGATYNIVANKTINGMTPSFDLIDLTNATQFVSTFDIYNINRGTGTYYYVIHYTNKAPNSASDKYDKAAGSFTGTWDGDGGNSYVDSEGLSTSYDKVVSP